MQDFTCDTNYLQPSGFKITVSKKNYPHLAFFAQTIQHPAMQISSTELGYKRIAGIPFIGDAITFGAVSLDVIMDEKMNVYSEIFNWMSNMVESKHQLNSGFLYTNGDTSLSDYNDIRITILNSANNAQREINYVNAFPISLGDVQFNSTTEETYITVPMTFRFDYFEFL